MHTNKQAQWLSCISEFTKDTKGELNKVTHVLSRICKICSLGSLDLKES